jgi:hypothetical protein
MEKKLKPKIYRLRRKFNTLVQQILDSWDEAPVHWKKPVLLPAEGLFKLEPDHPIHQTFGPLDDFDGAVPRWQSDPAFIAKVSAMQVLKGAEQELTVIARERRALQIWAHEEYTAIVHGLCEAGTTTVEWH